MVGSRWRKAWAVVLLSLITGCSARPEHGASQRAVALLPGADAGPDSGADSGTDSGADAGLDSGSDAGDAGDAGGCARDSDCGQGCAQCVAGACSTLGPGTTCRAAAGACDLAEKCDGVAVDCPADVKRAAKVECRAAAGACDLAEACDGASNDCPADVLVSKGTVCRGAAGVCDVAESCDGNQPDCPKDAVAAKTQVCRAATLACDVAENCDGSGVDCPADAFKASSVECRASAGACDVAEKCTGSSATCPNDGKLPSGAVCRAAAGVCDASETCDGSSSACPADLKMPTTTVCRAAASGGCDVAERCAGGDACPADQFASSSTVCRAAADVCDAAESCSGVSASCPADAKVASGVVCRAAAGVCDAQETCNGVQNACPADKLQAAGASCQVAACNATSGVLTPPSSCTGTSTGCPAAANQACTPYACTLTPSPSCRSSCSGDGDCLTAFYCAGGQCLPRVNAGKACQNSSECSASNPYCVDGVCCNVPCNGQCEACNLPNRAGTCSGVDGAPVGARTACAGDGSSCSGKCSSANRTACVFAVNGSECRPPSCDAASNSSLAASRCDGTGTCRLTQPVACAPYVCGATACSGACVLDGQCAPGSYCQGGSCVPQGDPGGACTADTQCVSGHCSDGVCCDSACRGQCEACNLPSSLGSCQAVTGPPLGARSACNGGADACAGSCDGTRREACSYPGTGTRCADASCQGGVATPAAFCDGSGACASPAPVSCANGCKGPLCMNGGCAVDADCKDSARYCAGGVCAPKLGSGSACPSDAACVSGFCVDGVCCDARCNGQCEACDVAGSVGTCSPAPSGDAPHGVRAACVRDGSTCGGSCGGSVRDACAYPSGNVCRPGQCSPGANAGDVATAVAEARCVGNGACPAPRSQSCGADGCDASAARCAGACATDPNSCSAGQTCIAGECVAQRGVGLSCAGDRECDSGFCVDGVCCTTRCAEQCAACDLPGKLGTCSAVSGAVHGGRPGCDGAGTCAAQCDGVSTASCAFASSDVSCGAAYCGAGSAALGARCDGNGACAPGALSACETFNCQGPRCDDACSSSAECVGAAQCIYGKCQLPVPPLLDVTGKGSCGCRVAGGPAQGERGGRIAFALLLACATLAARRRTRQVASHDERAARAP